MSSIDVSNLKNIVDALSEMKELNSISLNDLYINLEKVSKLEIPDSNKFKLDIYNMNEAILGLTSVDSEKLISFVTNVLRLKELNGIVINNFYEDVSKLSELKFENADKFRDDSTKLKDGIKGLTTIDASSLKNIILELSKLKDLNAISLSSIYDDVDKISKLKFEDADKFKDDAYKIKVAIQELASVDASKFGLIVGELSRFRELSSITFSNFYSDLDKLSKLQFTDATKFKDDAYNIKVALLGLASVDSTKLRDVINELYRIKDINSISTDNFYSGLDKLSKLSDPLSSLAYSIKLLTYELKGLQTVDFDKINSVASSVANIKSTTAQQSTIELNKRITPVTDTNVQNNTSSGQSNVIVSKDDRVPQLLSELISLMKSGGIAVNMDGRAVSKQLSAYENHTALGGNAAKRGM